MRMNKCAYLFAAALVASTVGMTSCSNEEVAGIEQGVENKVTLTMSMADKFGTRSTADDVNLGGLSAIENVVVVPMIKDAYQNPILMGQLTPSGTTATKSVQAPLNSNVNAFKVYGNVAEQEPKIFDPNKIFAGFSVSAVARLDKINGQTVYDPHGLYYYGYAKAGDNNILVGNSVSPNTPLEKEATIGKNSYVTVKGVNYAVGVLAAAIFNGDASELYVSSNPDGTSPSEAVKGGDEGNIDITGIIIDGQYKTLDQDFEKKGEDIVSVYEEVATGKEDFAASKLQFTEVKNTNGGNFYVVVTETGSTTAVGGNVTGNIEFTLAAGKYIKTNAGTVIGGAEPTKFYLPFVLKPTTDKAVFMKDYTTLFNATVKDWGLISDKPVEITDVNLAVEIDVQWNQGIVYDVEI